MLKKNLLVLMTVALLITSLVMDSCKDKSTNDDPEEPTEFVVKSYLDMYNCDGYIYEVLVDGYVVGVVGENPDPSKCYPYSYTWGSYHFYDTFKTCANVATLKNVAIRRNGSIVDAFPTLGEPDLWVGCHLDGTGSSFDFIVEGGQLRLK